MSTRVKRACIISGNGSWGVYGGGTLARLNHNYATVIGTSTGALMSPFVALREWEYLKIKFTSLNNKKFYDKYFLKPEITFRHEKASLLATILTLLLKKKSIFTTKKLREFIDDMFTEEYFDEIQKHSKEILVGVQNYAQAPSKIHFFNGFYETHEDMKDWIWCSMNYPFHHSLAKKAWKDKTGSFHVGYWCNGLSDLTGFDELFNEKFTHIDIILNRERIVEKYEGNKIKNLIDYIFTAFSSIREDIEHNCLLNKIKQLNKNGTTVTIYWLPRQLNLSPMLFNSDYMLKWWEEGYVTAFDEARIDVYPPISKW